MTFISILFLIYIAVLDMRIFHRQDDQLYRMVFRFHPVILLFWGCITLIILLNEGFTGQNLSAFGAVFVLPVYFFYRQRFVRTMQTRDAAYGTDGNNKDVLLSDLYGGMLIGYLGVFMISIAVALLTRIFPVQDSDMAELMVSNVLALFLFLFLIRNVLHKYSQADFLSSLHFGFLGKSFARVILLPAFVGIIFAGISSYVILSRDVQPATPLSELVDSTQSSALLMVFLLVAVFVAPISEELIFRGYLFQTLHKTFGLSLAVTVTAMSFAVLHVGQYWGDWAAIGMVGLLGVVLTLFRATTGTTLASTVMHYVYNAGVSIIPIFFLYFANPAYFEYQTMVDSTNTERQIQLLQESIRIDPNLADAHNDLAWLYAESDTNLDKALILVEKALVLVPEAEAYLDTKAVVLEKLGRIEEAEAIRQQLLESEYEVEVREVVSDLTAAE